MKLITTAIVLGFVLTAKTMTALADTITWTGAVSSDWNNATNWTPQEVPTASDQVIINSGSVVIPANGTFSIMNWIAGTISGALTVASNAVLNWSGGSLGDDAALTVATNAVLDITGSVVLEGGLTNAGTVNWQAGEVTVISGYGNYYGVGGVNTYYGAILNQPGGVWNIACDQTLVDYFDDAQFNNAGLIEKTADTSITAFNVFLANSGTVHAESGTIDFNGGSDLGGTFQADASAAIYFTSGEFTLSQPPPFQGPGPVELTTGTTITLSNFVGTFGLDGPSLTGQSTLAGGTLNWSGGSLGDDAALTVATNAVLDITGSVVLEGGLTNAGTVNWQAGEVTVISGYGNYYGVGGVNTYYGAILNQPGGVWNIACDQTLVDYFDDAQFNNAGLIEKTADTSITAFNVFLANSGTVHAESGTIDFNGGSDLGGTFQADASAAIYFTSGEFTLSQPPPFQGPGPVELTTGTTITLSNFVGTFGLDGPSLTGQSTLAGGTLNWSGGSLGDDAALTVATNAVLDITGSVVLEGGLTNAGTVNWQAGEVTVISGYGNYYGVGGVNTYYGAILNQPGGVWNIACDQTLVDYFDDAQFNNAGLIEKTADTSITAFNVFLANSGTVHAESGTIDFNGGYSGTSSANLAISLGGATPGSGYGTIAFSTPFAPEGLLTVSTSNEFEPTSGEVFNVLSYPSYAGEFTCLNLDLGGGFLLEPQFNSTGLALVTTTYVVGGSEPHLLISVSGKNATLQWPLGYPDWTVQTTTNLASPSWSPVYTTCGNDAVVPISAAKQYFRMKSP